MTLTPERVEAVARAIVKRVISGTVGTKDLDLIIAVERSWGEWTDEAIAAIEADEAWRANESDKPTTLGCQNGT